MLKKDRHTPVRKGPVYCSPYCGFGCTWKAFQHATAQAEKLCAVLGGQWIPDVWENFGWHWAAQIDEWRISPFNNYPKSFDETPGWTFFLNGAPHQIVISIEEHDPRVAVKMMVEAVQKTVDEWKKQHKAIVTAWAEMPSAPL